MSDIYVEYPTKDRITIKNKKTYLSIYMNEDPSLWGKSGIHIWVHGDPNSENVANLIAAIDNSSKREKIQQFMQQSAALVSIPPLEIEEKHGLIVDKNSKAFRRAIGLVK